jgi:hypothetical protein
MKKLELWKRNTERNIFDESPTFESCHPTNETKANMKLSTNDLAALQKRLSLYFKDVGVSKFEWVRNPSAPSNVSGSTTCEQEQLIDISCDGYLKYMFDADRLPQFWLFEKNDYPSLSGKAIKILFPFVTTYRVCRKNTQKFETRATMGLLMGKVKVDATGCRNVTSFQPNKQHRHSLPMIK